ncbi:MAG: hypothetical protein ACPG43_03535 [Alcanivoracaceae bacterium]
MDLSLVPAEQCGSWQSNTIHEPRRLEDHVIRVSRDGNMLNVRDRETIHSEEQAKEALNHMMCEAELLARSKGSSKVRILIYAHGGLNSYGSTDERILEDHQALKMMNEDDEWYYPIYISWDSSLQTSYPEHIFRLREGYKSNILVGVPTSLVVFPSDILTTVGRYPATVTYQAINDKNRFASIRYAPWLNGAWKNALLKMCDGRLCEGDKRFSGDSSPLEANLSSYFKDSGWRQAGRATYDILSLPVRYTVGSIYHSAIASSSWNVMKRRAVMPYYPASYFDGRWESGVSGGQVFPAVLSRARASKQYDYELTLVGHSMGTMVMNEALTRYRKAFLAGDELQNIVYMAAAADIGDSMAALKPILVANGAARSEPVNFYNLTLNRVAEVAEMHWLGALPTGSLLVSIDQHHEHPEHPVRRTLGSEVNVLTAIEELDEAFRGAKGDLVFKAFDRKPGEYPRHHADFSKMDFWRSDVWQLPGS